MNRFINLRMWIDPLQHTEHRFETFLALFSPLFWHDSIITQYTIDRLISSVVVGTNVRLKSTSTTGAEKQTRQVDLSFRSNTLLSLRNFAKKRRESFPFYEIHSREKERGKRNDRFVFNFILVFIYDVHFNISISNIEYLALDFHVNFFIPKEILCLLIIISIYPISRNYKIPFRFALFEQKSFLTIRRNF